MSDDVVIVILAKNKEYCLQFYLNCLYNLDFDKKRIHLLNFVNRTFTDDDKVRFLKW